MSLTTISTPFFLAIILIPKHNNIYNNAAEEATIDRAKESLKTSTNLYFTLNCWNLIEGNLAVSYHFMPFIKKKFLSSTHNFFPSFLHNNLTFYSLSKRFNMYRHSFIMIIVAI